MPSVQSEKPPWFAGREVPVVFYKVNRWPLAQEDLFAERIEDQLEHVALVLKPGEAVTTGRRFRRTWYVGDIHVERKRHFIVGQIGWERPDLRELGKFDPDLKSW